MNLNINAICYRYNKDTPNQVLALNQVSFRMGGGEVIGLVGLSGAGKSCLLHCLAKGLSPDSGTITMTGLGLGRTETGLVIQDPEQQFFAATVREEVAFALAVRGFSPSEVQFRVKLALERVGFDGDLDCSPFQLSGGQQRRIALASILVMDPELLLLDEPTVGLDRQGVAVIRNLIAAYREAGRLVIIASHEPDFLYDLADRFIVLHCGRLVLDFPKRHFSQYIEPLKEYQIGIPEWVALQQRQLPEFIRDYFQRVRECDGC